VYESALSGTSVTWWGKRFERREKCSAKKSIPGTESARVGVTTSTAADS
jgi:hypothetical protein